MFFSGVCFFFMFFPGLWFIFGLKFVLMVFKGLFFFFYVLLLLFGKRYVFLSVFEGTVVCLKEPLICFLVHGRTCGFRY